MVVSYFASQFVVVGLWQLLPMAGDETLVMMLVQAAVYVVMLAIGAGGPYLFKKKLKLPKIHELLAVGRRPKLSDLGSGVKYLLIYYGVLLAVTIPLGFLLPEIMGEKQEIGFSLLGNAPWELILIFISLVVVAPVAEELLMRGVLFGRLRAKLPFLPTAILVSLVFAVAHWQINVSIDTFILSMAACFAREKTGTVFPGILIHMVKNGIAFGVLFLT